MRAAKLRKQLERDKLRTIRRMETLEQDMILVDIHTIWEEIYPPWDGHIRGSLPDGKSSQVGGVVMGCPIPLPHLTRGILWLEREAR